MLSSVDLSNVMSLDARRLSSGQRQRLALARALALEPRTLFLDEPFANVDADGRPGLRELVREYIARSDCALVLATQNLADVTTLCKKAMVLEDGVPIEMLDVSAIETSRNPYLQAIVCESRLLP
jgi:ABC-type sulfate/molybdate transport systems ATPase subunit